MAKRNSESECATAAAVSPNAVIKFFRICQREPMDNCPRQWTLPPHSSPGYWSVFSPFRRQPPGVPKKASPRQGELRSVIPV